MVTTATTVKWFTLKSELEALLVEAELIRTHQPQFNVLLKDDKSPLYIHITDEIYPRVITVRKKELMTRKLAGTTLGPFPSAFKVKEVLKLIRPIFPWCNLAGNLTKPAKACFYYHLELCPGACLREISPHDYRHQISHLVLFLRGKTKEVTSQLKAEMLQASSEKQFETAGQIRDQIELIEEVTSYKKKLQPQLILPTLQQNQKEEGLIRLRKIIADYLPIPRDYRLTRIEGYDVSNTQGTNPAVAQVCFIDGQSAPEEYRLFNIRSLQTPNDYAMMKEALVRRQRHPEWGMPQLVVIDGGKGQLRAALSVWQWSNPVISIAKNPDRLIIPLIQQPPTKSGQQSTKSSRPTTKYQILKLEPGHPALKLVQQIRDESHRFSKKQHSRMRTKNLTRFSRQNPLN
jgi:excinuclease ABC subunit C